ncbi:MAG: EmrB/QacA subfamily drug resistance transporter [Candidatus Saccharibacteria bacterium]|nr:EmrB/QacA subfamily drug resistance transporter [Candidatus Saccharibacteria bacterium]
MTKTKRTTLILLALAMFLVVLDSAIINVALPAIKSALGFSTADLQWVVTGYVLTFGGFLMLGGRTADLFGRRRILLIGIAGFTISSLLIGLSVNAPMMIALRAVQGIAGAFMLPTALSILLTTFHEGPERHKAMSVWSLVASSGAAAGVFLGGMLTQFLDWRWCFFVNVPVGILAFYLIRKHVPAHIAESKDKQLDVPGAVLVTGGLMLLVYALTLASQIGWTNLGTIAAFAVSAALLAGFVYNESRAAHPLMPFGIFKLGNIAAGSVIMLPIMAGAFGMFFFSSLFVQNALGYSPAETGIAFLPIPIVIGIFSYNAPKLLARFGYRILLITGTAIITIGTFLLSLMGPGVDYLTQLLPLFVFIAVGFGTAFVALFVAATNGIPGHEAGLASGITSTAQQIGGALGLAVLAVVAAATTASAAADGTTTAAASVLGYQRAFLAASLMMAAALLISILYIKEDRSSH